ncbi:MAG TPA: flagellar basal body rod protein FlgC [Clostridiales bacterium]|nr:flagellar basal body rod protein FlgC [Clostridiales bacterium]
MRLLQTLRTSMSALTAERLRLDLIAGNLANLNTTRTPAGEPYRRLVPVFSPRPAGGVEVTGVVADPAEFPVRHDPGHPDADADGFVRMPNVDLVAEMVDLMAATRAYEANATVAQATRTLAQRTLEIGRS